MLHMINITVLSVGCKVRELAVGWFIYTDERVILAHSCEVSKPVVLLSDTNSCEVSKPVVLLSDTYSCEVSKPVVLL